MAKILTGKVVTSKMFNTIIVEVEHRVPHPLYKKLLKRTRRFKVDSTGQTVIKGEKVRIMETRPISRDKHFILMSAKKEEAK